MINWARGVCALLALLLLSGCASVDWEIRARQGGILEFTAALTEAELNQALAESLAADPDTFLRAGRIDLSPGQMVLYGTFRTGDGTTEGTFVFGLRDADGRVRVRLEDIALVGYDPQQAEIVRVEVRLGTIIDNRVAQAQSDVQALATPEASPAPEATAEAGAVLEATEATEPALTVRSEVTDDAIRVTVALDLRR